jgi:hypothetical protein
MESSRKRRWGLPAWIRLQLPWPVDPVTPMETLAWICLQLPRLRLSAGRQAVGPRQRGCCRTRLLRGGGSGRPLVGAEAEAEEGAHG